MEIFIGAGIISLIVLIIVKIVVKNSRRRGKTFWKAFYEKEALNELKRACITSISCYLFDSHISMIHDYLKRAESCLGDIKLGGRKVTEQIIEKLKIENRKVRAKENLKTLRGAALKGFANNPDSFILPLREITQYTNEVGLSLEEIGSIKEELEKFRIEIAKAMAKATLRKVLKILEKNGLTFENLGITVNGGEIAALLMEVDPPLQS